MHTPTGWSWALERAQEVDASDAQLSFECPWFSSVSVTYIGLMKFADDLKKTLLIGNASSTPEVHSSRRLCMRPDGKRGTGTTSNGPQKSEG